MYTEIGLRWKEQKNLLIYGGSRGTCVIMIELSNGWHKKIKQYFDLLKNYTTVESTGKKHMNKWKEFF